MKKLFALLLTLALLLSLTACGGSSKSTNSAMQEAPAAREEAIAEDGSLTTSGSNGSNALPENRKWVITVDMNVEAEDMDTMLSALDEKINTLGGYVEDQSIHNGSAYASRRYRSASLTVRIPAEKVDAFTQEMEGIANVVSNNLRREDITLTYVSTESRIATLKTEQTRLMELMAQAETMADLLEIEQRLTDVNYELESYTSRLKVYDNQVDYATIYLDISEVQEYTPVAEPTFWERLTDGFRDSLKGLGDSLLDLIVFVVAASPYLVVYGGMGFGIWTLVRKFRDRKGKRTRKEIPKEPENK